MLQSSLIGKIEKSKRYAQEPDRITFLELDVKFRGDNDDHRVSLKDSKWQCTCRFFSQWGLCTHTMTLERVLGGMLPEPARTGAAAVAASTPHLL